MATPARRRSFRGSVNDWTSTLTRIVGVAGFIYELAFDQFRNPTAIVVSAGLAGLPDVLNYRSAVREQVRREAEDYEA